MVQTCINARKQGERKMLDAMMSGFGWGVMLGVMVMLSAGATVTLSPVLLAGVGGSFWQGVKRVTQ
ncbi:MAG: hypothetical protein KME13_24290 [Myxacorys californica WJT36-NPBG1]|nr:hypothetical protein [Myxacorys californica WJT36-NPBG1]